MKQLLRILSVLTILFIFCSVTTIGLLRMSRPKLFSASGSTTELRFVGAYTPLLAGTASVSEIYERANPAVVRITATHLVRQEEANAMKLPDGHPEVEREKRSRGIGTGCVIDAEGYIVTNQHVVDQADQIRVRFLDNTEVSANLIGYDTITDLALLKITPINKISVMPLGDSSKLRIGEPVIAIGNPYSYDRTVTTGVVSAKGRKVFNYLYEDYIQTDAAINVGNSGGPLLNLSGELIGINSVVRADANGISFAIPVNQMKHVISQLKLHGQVVRGFLGIQPDSINDEIREALGLENRVGALVTYVNPDSAASKAGIQVYDVIMKFNGFDVFDKDTLYRLIAEATPGQHVEIELIRNHEFKHVTAMLTQREGPRVSVSTQKNDLKKVSLGRVGFSVQDKGPQVEKILRVSGNSKDLSGVVITEIDPLSSAADAGLQSGFVIVEVNRNRIVTTADFEKEIENLKDGEVALLRVAGDRGSNQPFFITAIRLGE
jgi:serine protease Do